MHIIISIHHSFNISEPILLHKSVIWDCMNSQLWDEKMTRGSFENEHDNMLTWGEICSKDGVAASSII